jgi:Putative addiction module component
MKNAKYELRDEYTAGDFPRLQRGQFLHEAAAADIDNAWVYEAQRRLRAYECGLTQGVPAEEVLGPF